MLRRNNVLSRQQSNDAIDDTNRYASLGFHSFMDEKFEESNDSDGENLLDDADRFRTANGKACDRIASEPMPLGSRCRVLVTQPSHKSDDWQSTADEMSLRDSCTTDSRYSTDSSCYRYSTDSGLSVNSIDNENFTRLSKKEKVSVHKMTAIDESSDSSSTDSSPYHQLHTAWTLYYRDSTSKLKRMPSDYQLSHASHGDEDMSASAERSPTTYADENRQIHTCDTVESFWQMFHHLPLPTQLKYRSSPNYMFFRRQIKPEWEDEANTNGGMWRVVLRQKERTEHLDRFWIELLLAIIGEQFTFYNYVTGCVLQRRQKEDRIQLWTRGNPDKAQDEQIQQLIGIEFKHVLNLCPTTELTYTKHNQVMVLDDIKKSKGTFDGYYMRDDNKLSSKGKRSRSRNRRRSRSRSKSGQNSRRNSSQQLLPALATPAEASEQIINAVGQARESVQMLGKNKSFTHRMEEAFKTGNGYKI